MKVRRLLDSFNYAIQGIIHTVHTQRNMKIHISTAIAVLVLSLFFDLSKIELMLVSLSITLVLAMELLNTAIENTIDLISDHYHPLAKFAKNAAAGAVLVSAINAVLVGYLVFYDRLVPMSVNTIRKVRQTPPYITFICIALVMLIVICVKSYCKNGTPLKGGMPSGHCAIAFSAATIITLLTKNVLIMTLSIIMGLLVAQTRVEAKVHSVFEAVIGSLLGVLVTVLIFQLFNL